MSRRKSRDGHTTNALLSYHTASAVYDLVYLFFKNIRVCNAQLMQKAQQKRYKQWQLSEQKSFQSPPETVERESEAESRIS